MYRIVLKSYDHKMYYKENQIIDGRKENATQYESRKIAIDRLKTVDLAASKIEKDYGVKFTELIIEEVVPLVSE